jgi:hypothetical protein
MFPKVTHDEMNRTVAVAGVDHFPSLAHVVVHTEWHNVRSVDKWPGFENLRDDIVVDFKGNKETVGEMRRRLNLESAAAAAAAEEERRAEQQRIEEAQRLRQFTAIRQAIAGAPGEVPPVLSAAITQHDDCLTFATPQTGTLLHVAASVGAVKSASALARVHPALAQQFDEEGCLPLHLAARGNHVGVIDVLVGTVGWQSKAQRTPLHEAAQRNHVGFVNALLERNVEVDAIDEDGRTPLILAAQDNAVEAYVALAKHGANQHVKARDGKSAIDVLRSVNRELADKMEAIERQAGIDALLNSAKQQWLAQHKGVSFDARDTLRHAATAERIRCGKFDPLTDPLVKTAALEPHGRTLLALGLAAHPAAAFDDVNELLSEQAVLGAQQSPLFVLAHARMHALRDGFVNATSIALLREHVRVAGGDECWLSEAEKELLQRASSGALEIGKRHSDDEGRAASPLETRWAELSAKLAPGQRKPMEELLKLTGLDAVKKVALDVYGSVLADEQLKRAGHARAMARETLNFAFVGNPGTGKTTVARLFAELLEQAGARAGHRFVQMTASQALRKGAKTFATEMAALTGSSKSVGPPPRPLRRGANVEVDVGGKRYPAEIVRVDSDKKVYDVKFTDATVEENVAERRVQPVGEGQAVGGVLFLDEAYDLDPANNADGRAILAEIMSVAEDHRDTVTIILAGYKDDM